MVALSFFLAVTPVNAVNFGDFVNFFGYRFNTPVATPATRFRPVGTTPAGGAIGKPQTPRGTVTKFVDRASRLQELANRMFDRFQNRIDKYTDFLAKVQSRRDKLFADGKDVSRLDSFITTAKTNLDTVKTVFTNAKNTLASLDYNANPGMVIKQVRDQLNLVREALTTLHKSMSETVKEIKNLTAESIETTTTPKTPCTPLPLCAIEGVAGPDGTKAFCDLKPNINYCPRKCVPYPTNCNTENKVVGQDGRVYCNNVDLNPNINYCPPPSCTPLPSCAYNTGKDKNNKFCKIGANPPDGGVWCPRGKDIGK